MSKPWLYLSDYFERHRREYVDHLFEVSATGDWSPWIRFCLEGTIAQAKDAIVRCDRLRGLRERFLTQIGTGGGSARLIAVVEQLFQNPFVGVAELADKLQVYYQTAQKYLERLADIGILKELPNHQPRTFFSPEIFHIAYEDLGSISE